MQGDNLCAVPRFRHPQRVAALPRSMVMIGITAFSNIIISYLLMYRYDYGIEGAAYGTVASFFLGTSFGLFYLFRNRVELKLVNTSKLVLNDLLNFGGESLNLFLRTFFLLSTFFVATALASHISPHTVAAQDIALKLWIFGAFLMDGFAITATSLGGKLVVKRTSNYGEKLTIN